MTVPTVRGSNAGDPAVRGAAISFCQAGSWQALKPAVACPLTARGVARKRGAAGYPTVAPRSAQAGLKGEPRRAVHFGDVKEGWDGPSAEMMRFLVVAQELV